MAFGDKVLMLRGQRGESLQQVADAIGSSKGHVSDIERGVARNPSLEVVQKLAAHFGVSLAFLVDDQPARPILSGSAAQVNGWVRMIQKEQAAGCDLETAAAEARISYEDMQGAPLDAVQELNWQAARDQIEAALTADIEYLGANSLTRKPRRPDWYAGPKVADQNWPGLRGYLMTRSGWSPDTLESLDRTSTEVVSLVENPAQSQFSGRGLVVGYVQSGKTANMTAVIAKAADAGYRFVIVLAGLTNALRRQTQRRLETDLVDRNPHGWHMHTTADDNGDFRTPPSRWFTVMESIQIAVIKKNVTPLQHLIRTIKKTTPAQRERLPILIIDDECDQAGVNAGGQYDVTRINMQIRTLLGLLPRAQYVGYTATPFANVLINPDRQDGGLDDLYPADFITSLPKPAGYFGPESLFGRDPIDADQEAPDERGLDMIRLVKDEEVAKLRPSGTKDRATFQPEITPSLDKALRYFLMATAARYARGQRDRHCTMLVHTTSYVLPHERMAAQIREWLDAMAGRLDEPELLDALRTQWEDEAAKVDGTPFGLTAVTWTAVQQHLATVLSDLEIIVENSASETRLDFTGGPRKYIVVGGSVLARGLTIEGLTVSYFVRSSSQYDTLLQMGRWFGFRKGFEDLPRIWMTGDLSGAFRDLALVEAEIRADIATYREDDKTPRDFAVRIRQIPGMTVTSAAKMIAAEACDVSFSGEHLQTIRFPADDKALLDANWIAGADLVSAAVADGRAIEPRPRGRLIRGVRLALVLEFLQRYGASAKDQFSPRLLEYIRAEAARADAPFQEWNVGLIERDGTPIAATPLGALGTVRTVQRAKLGAARGDGLADIKALMSRADVLLDSDAKATGTSWPPFKIARQEALGDRIPLLLLYAIDRASPADPDSDYRVPLDAAADVLGVGLVLPERGEKRSYVRVTLNVPDADDEEDLAADLPASNDAVPEDDAA